MNVIPCFARKRCSAMTFGLNGVIGAIAAPYSCARLAERNRLEDPGSPRIGDRSAQPNTGSHIAAINAGARPRPVFGRPGVLARCTTLRPRPLPDLPDDRR